MRYILPLLLLSACAGNEPLLRPVNVEVPLAIPCATPPVTKPDFAIRGITQDDDIAEKTRAALIELNQRRAYEAEMEAQIEACR